MNKSKNQFKLYNYFPAFLAIIFTPFGFIPLFGNFILNVVFILVILLISHHLTLKHLVKNTFLSYLIAMCGLILGLLICNIGQSAPFDFQNASIEEMRAFARTYKEEDAMLRSTIFIYIGFIISTIAIFLGHIFLTFGKRTRDILYHKISQRIVYSVILTIFNAPYLLFISNDFLESIGYNIFLPTML